MLRSIMAALATATAASRVRSVARQTGFGAIAIFALMIALVFASIAVFYLLLPVYGPAIAAAIIAGGTALIAFVVSLWAFNRQKNQQDNWMAELGLPTVRGVDAKNVGAVVDRAQVAIRRAGPVKLSLAAIAAAFLISRLK